MERAKEGAPERTSVLKSTDTAKEIRRLVKRIYYGAREAKEAGKPVAWVMGETLAEDILTAMGVAGIYPENYGGLAATKRAELPYLERAEAEGYSHTVCGYARVALGFAAVRHELGIIPPDAPDGGMVDPDMLIGSSNICDPRYKWFQALGHYMKAPLHVTDILLPPVDRDLQALWHYYVSYQTEEVRELLRFVERVVGRKVDQDQLIEAVNNDTQTLRLTHEIYELRKAVPCPMPAQDWFLCGILLHFLPAENDTVAFYTRLRDELKNRVEKGIGTIPEEKYRLLWSGLPPWHHMYIYNYFESLGATFPAELAYYVAWHAGKGFEVEEARDDPLKTIAERNLKRWTTWYEPARKGCGHAHSQMILDMIRDYKLDGVVAHLNNSCRVTNIGHVHAANLAQQLGVPTLLLESDIVDARDYSDTLFKAKIHAFIETLGSHGDTHRL